MIRPTAIKTLPSPGERAHGPPGAGAFLHFVCAGGHRAHDALCRVKTKGVRHLSSRHLRAVLPMPWPRRAGSCTTARQTATASMDPSGSTAMSMRTVHDGASNPDPDRLCWCCWLSCLLPREPPVGQHQRASAEAGRWSPATSTTPICSCVVVTSMSNDATRSSSCCSAPVVLPAARGFCRVLERPRQASSHAASLMGCAIDGLRTATHNQTPGLTKKELDDRLVVMSETPANV